MRKLIVSEFVTLDGVMEVFSCPVCGEPLPRAGRSYRCGNGHTFDIAREGYTNLLLAQYRRSKDPGYSKDMIAGRRDFFDAGLRTSGRWHGRPGGLLPAHRPR
ncbi:MAG: putative RNA methyltransferase [Pseudonocardiaceae bacterium]